MHHDEITTLDASITIDCSDFIDVGSRSFHYMHPAGVLAMMGHSIGNYMTFDFDSPEWPAKANVMIINGGAVNVGKEIRFEAAKGTTLPKFVKKRLQEGTEQLLWAI